jgi:hypothetical protein
MPLQRAIEYLFPDNDDDVELVIENKDRFRHEHKGKRLAIYERMVGSSHRVYENVVGKQAKKEYPHL